MGTSRKRRMGAAESAAGGAATSERQQAGQLGTELQQRKDILGAGLPGNLAATQASAQRLYETGGLEPEDIAGAKAGYGELATTGGFTPEQQTQFLRRGTAPVAAMYGRAQDQLARQKSLQGGYSPGFGASQSRLLRQGSQAGAEASLGANVNLAEQIRQGKTAGLGGLTGIAGMTQQGRIAGQTALQRYTSQGIQALTDTDIIGLRNRLQTGQLSMDDAQLLAHMASQDPTLLQQIKGWAGTIGGAISGAQAGFGG